MLKIALLIINSLSYSAYTLNTINILSLVIIRLKWFSILQQKFMQPMH